MVMLQVEKSEEKIFIKLISYSDWGLKRHKNLIKKLSPLEDKIFICEDKIDLLRYIQKLVDEYNTKNEIKKEDTLSVITDGNYIFRINQINMNISYVAEIIYYTIREEINLINKLK